MDKSLYSDRIFSNYGMLLAKVSDLQKMLRILRKCNLSIALRKDTVYINSIEVEDLKQELDDVKKMNLKIEGDKEFTYIRVHWSESDNKPIVTDPLKKNGFNFYFMGDDGSWLATPYYLVTSKKSHGEIKNLVQNGYFKEVSKGLWNILNKKE